MRNGLGETQNLFSMNCPNEIYTICACDPQNDVRSCSQSPEDDLDEEVLVVTMHSTPIGHKKLGFLIQDSEEDVLAEQHFSL